MRVTYTLLLGAGTVAGCFSEPGRPGQGCEVGDGVPTSTFEVDTQCMPFATDYGSMVTFQNDRGRLHIEPTQVGTDGGCRQGIRFALPPEGIFMNVPLAAAGPGQYTGFSIDDEGDSIVAEDGVLALAPYIGPPYATVVFQPSRMSWWRMRADPSSGKLIGEYSSNAGEWTKFAESAAAAPTTAQIGLRVGSTQLATEAAAGEFDNLNVCPQ